MINRGSEHDDGDDHVPAGTLVRPGLVGRLVRLLLGFATGALTIGGFVWVGDMIRTGKILTPSTWQALLALAAAAWLAPLAGKVLVSGAARQWLRWLVLAGAGVLAVAGWITGGDPFGPALAVPVVLLAWSLLVLLSLSFLLAAAFAVPG